MNNDKFWTHEILFEDLEGGTTYTDRVGHEMFAQAIVNAYYLRYVVSNATRSYRQEVLDGNPFTVTVIRMEGVKRP